MSSSFIHACAAGRAWEMHEYLEKQGADRVNVHEDDDRAFVAACSGGSLVAVKMLLALTGDRYVNVHARATPQSIRHGENIQWSAFWMACVKGHLHIVRELLSLTGQRRINVHADSAGAFTSVCMRGHLNVMRELLALQGDRRINVRTPLPPNAPMLREWLGYDRVFIWVCYKGHVDVARELLSLTGDRRVDVHHSNNAAFIHACNTWSLFVLRELLQLRGDRRINLSDVYTDESAVLIRDYDPHVVRELLLVEKGYGLCFAIQRACIEHLKTATAQWTSSVTTWKSIGVDLHALCPTLRKHLCDQYKQTVWKHRRLLIAARTPMQWGCFSMGTESVIAPEDTPSGTCVIT